MRTYITKKLFYICAFSALIVSSISSCKKLDEYNPASLSEQNVLTNFAGWKAYQSNIYNGLWGSLIGLQYGLVSGGIL